MKRLLLIIIGLVAAGMFFVPDASAQNQKIAYGQWTTNSTSLTVPIPLYPTDMWVTSATVLGRKAVRTANTGSVYVGPSSVNDTQPYTITSDSEIVIKASEGTFFNLNDWYLDIASSGDGVVILFQ